MVQLKAKGHNQYLETSSDSVALAQIEGSTVMSAVRTAVDIIASRPDAAYLPQVLTLRKLLSDMSSEIEEMQMIVNVVERRIMEL